MYNKEAYVSDGPVGGMMTPPRSHPARSEVLWKLNQIINGIV
jgi:hypothetical protein